MCSREIDSARVRGFEWLLSTLTVLKSPFSYVLIQLPLYQHHLLDSTQLLPTPVSAVSDIWCQFWTNSRVFFPDNFSHNNLINVHMLWLRLVVRTLILELCFRGNYFHSSLQSVFPGYAFRRVFLKHQRHVYHSYKTYFRF